MKIRVVLQTDSFTRYEITDHFQVTERSLRAAAQSIGASFPEGLARRLTAAARKAEERAIEEAIRAPVETVSSLAPRPLTLIERIALLGRPEGARALL